MGVTSVPNLIHPTSTVSRFAKFGEGVVIHINSIVHPDVIIGDNTILSYNVAITHNSQIGKNCYLANYVGIGAYTKVEDNVFLGMGSMSISGKVDVIGEGSYVGAGSLITKSVEPYTLVAGRPAKLIKYIVNQNNKDDIIKHT